MVYGGLETPCKPEKYTSECPGDNHRAAPPRKGQKVETIVRETEIRKAQGISNPPHGRLKDSRETLRSKCMVHEGSEMLCEAR